MGPPVAVLARRRAVFQREQDVYRLDILDADWCLGMAGSIEFRPLPGSKCYRLRHNSNDGLTLSEWSDPQGWSESRRVKEHDVLALLDPAWTWQTFKTAWQAFAEGMERQRDTGG